MRSRLFLFLLWCIGSSTHSADVHACSALTESVRQCTTAKSSTVAHTPCIGNIMLLASIGVTDALAYRA
jgi:hypothetical protein